MPRTLIVEGDGIALDALLFAAAGREDLVPAVLDANPGLARLGPVLPVGTRVLVPDMPEPESVPLRATVTLWSE